MATYYNFVTVYIFIIVGEFRGALRTTIRQYSKTARGENFTLNIVWVNSQSLQVFPSLRENVLLNEQYMHFKHVKHN
jgi:hypothetical protein